MRTEKQIWDDIEISSLYNLSNNYIKELINLKLNEFAEKIKGNFCTNNETLDRSWSCGECYNCVEINKLFEDKKR